MYIVDYLTIFLKAYLWPYICTWQEGGIQSVTDLRKEIVAKLL